jgi:hypothetical protein
MTAADACKYIDQGSELEDIYLVGFTGGEGFIFKNVMKEAMLYAARTYGLPSIVGSNSSFATSEEKAMRILERYRGIGLRRLQLSVDDFHQEWVPLERVRNAVKAAISLEIKVTLVSIVTEKTKKAIDYLREIGVEEGPFVQMTEAPCTPTGFGAERVPREDFKTFDGIPSEWCSLLRVINILPDGSVQLCCGAPFSLDVLKAGNANYEHLSTIIARAKDDPFFNALSAGNGVHYLVEMLDELGLDHHLRPGTYKSSCDACQDLVRKPEVVKALRQLLEKRKEEMLIARFVERDLPVLVLDELVNRPQQSATI